jgi:hypothetical protein
MFSQLDIKNTYIINKKPRYILRIKKDTKYEIIEYKKGINDYIPISLIDSGTYHIKNIFIEFKSNKGNDSIIDGRKLFISGKIYDCWWDKKTVYKKSDTSHYHSIGYREKVEKQKIKKSESDIFKTKYMEYLSIYSPSYVKLIDSVFCGPGCYYEYTNGKFSIPNSDTSAILSEYGVVSHESVHSFNTIFGYSGQNRRWKMRILVEPDIYVEFLYIDTYHSEYFLPIVPKEAPEKIFRYKNYVSPGTDVSANLIGIIGLLDEFSAYRNSTHASIEACKKNDMSARFFLKEALREYASYYEFRLFISWYLEYGELKYPEMHKKLMESTNIRTVFTLIERGFEEDIREIEKLVIKLDDNDFEYYESKYVNYCKSIMPIHEKTLNKFRINDVQKKTIKLIY